MFSVMSMCLSVQAITFELLHIDTPFLVCRYILTMSRSNLSIKVIGSRSRLYEKYDNFTYFSMLIPCILLQVINKVKFIHQGEGHEGGNVSIASHEIFLVTMLLLDFVAIELNSGKVILGNDYSTWELSKRPWFTLLADSYLLNSPT